MTNTDALKLMTAGKAILTFRSKVTGNRFTYKIEKAKKSDNLFFCSVLNGPDNYSNYRFFGFIRDWQFHQSSKAKVSADAPSVKAFTYTYNHLVRRDLTQVEIFHEGKCCRCGRKLTVPESIQSGIGPECLKHFR